MIDLASGVAVIDVPERLDGLVERECPVDHRPERPGGDHRRQGRHVLGTERLPPQHQAHLLALARRIRARRPGLQDRVPGRPPSVT